jgi:predicted GNAT family N-acyltransferase
VTASAGILDPLATLPFEVRVARSYAEFAEIARVRAQVFRDEQGMVAEEVWDGDDAHSINVYARAGNHVIAIGRLTPPVPPRTDGQIAWVATLPGHRGAGAGTAVMRTLLEIADARRIPRLLLSAQTHALRFYERLGFVRYGEPFLVKGIEHTYMQRCRQGLP